MSLFKKKSSNGGRTVTLLKLMFTVVLSVASFEVLTFWKGHKFRQPHLEDLLLSYDYGQTFNRTSAAINIISFMEVQMRFSYKTTDQCPLRYESSLFCPMLNCNLGNSLTLPLLKKYIGSIAEDIPLAPETEYILQIEKELFSFPSLKSVREVPSLDLSKIFPIDTKMKGDQVMCKFDQEIRLMVVLVDGFGKDRSAGHDDLRARLTEIVDLSKTPRQSAGHVRDLNNGSYLVTFRCLWPGTSQISIHVAYPREYLALVLKSRKRGIGRFSSGNFSNPQGDQEVTPCFSTPNLPWPCLCNFTEWNNASFYCGRPRNRNLTCQHLTAIGSLRSRDESTGMSPVERQLISSMSRRSENTRIKKNLVLNVSGSGKLSTTSDLPCSRASNAVTWGKLFPKGYFDNSGRWRTLLCSQDNITTDRLKSCLANSTMWLLGDSNSKAMLSSLKKLLNSPSKCSFDEDNEWYSDIHCFAQNLNFSFIFSRHEHNFYLSKNFNDLHNAKKRKSITQLIDSIPSSGRFSVIVHYYLHVICAHLSVARDRLERLRDAIARLVKRNPEVKFAFRGPHVSYWEWSVSHLQGGDTQAKFYLDIVKDVFKDLYNHVIFLDGWEMSIAKANNKFHPDEEMTDSMVRLFLDFTCG